MLRATLRVGNTEYPNCAYLFSRFPRHLQTDSWLDAGSFLVTFSAFYAFMLCVWTLKEEDSGQGQNATLLDFVSLRCYARVKSVDRYLPLYFGLTFLDFHAFFLLHVVFSVNSFLSEQR